MILNSFRQFVSNLNGSPSCLLARSAHSSRCIVLGVAALALICVQIRAEETTKFNRGPAERDIHFDLPGSPMGGLLNFVGNQGDFVRANPDGTFWLHGFDRDANLYLGIPLVDVWRAPEDMLVFFAGTGHITWFDIVTRNEETGDIQFTSEHSNITANFILTSTAAAQEILGIPEGTPFVFKARIVERDGENKLFDVIFEPVE